MRLLFSFIFLQLGYLSIAQVPMTKYKGQPFPLFAASNEYHKITNDSLSGKVVLINFWFEGCHPCLAEFDGLNELASTLKENKDFELISFTWDNVETVKRVEEKYKLQFKVFPLDRKECTRLNLGSGYPKTIILDRKGKIKYIVAGGSTDPKLATEYVMKTLLKEIQKEL